MEIVMKPVGYISSPYTDRKEIPRQSVLKEGVIGKVKLEDEFKEGIYGYEAGDHVVILFNFHKSKDTPMVINPHGMDEKRGLFATRSPNRPNPIGLTIAKIVSVDLDEGVLEFDGVDMLDGTPVLDMKPYSPGLNPKE